MTRRALVPMDELRRWAKVSCELGVAVTGHINPGGGATIVISPLSAASSASNDEFDNAMDKFLGRRP
jgi:hypothetical protein